MVKIFKVADKVTDTEPQRQRAYEKIKKNASADHKDQSVYPMMDTVKVSPVFIAISAYSKPYQSGNRTKNKGKE